MFPSSHRSVGTYCALFSSVVCTWTRFCSLWLESWSLCSATRSQEVLKLGSLELELTGEQVQKHNNSQVMKPRYVHDVLISECLDELVMNSRRRWNQMYGPGRIERDGFQAGFRILHP